MSIVVTPLGANSASAPGGTSWTAGSGVTLGTGDVVIFTNQDIQFGGSPVSGVTIGGVVATQIGTSGTGSSTGAGQAWIAQGVNVSTGNVVVSATSFSLISASWFLIVGESVVSAAFTATSSEGFNTPATQSVTGIVPTSGVGLVFLGGNILSATTPLPVSWTNCVASGDTTLESFTSAGNRIFSCGNYATVPGSVTPTATATGTAWTNCCSEMMMVTFSSASSGSVSDSFGNQMNLLQMKRKSIGWSTLLDHRRRVLRPNRFLLLPKRFKKVA